MGPKSLRTKNRPTRFSLMQISVFPTMVTLVLGGGGKGVQGGGGRTLLLAEKKKGSTSLGARRFASTRKSLE